MRKAAGQEKRSNGLTIDPGAVEAWRVQVRPRHVLPLQFVTFDPGPLVRRRQQHDGEDDQAQHRADHQQGDQNAPPVPLVGRRGHQLLRTQDAWRTLLKQPQTAFAYPSSNAGPEGAHT